MRNIRLIERSNSALGHIVILSVNDVKFLVGVDRSLNDLLCLLSIPLSGLLRNDLPALSSCGIRQRTGAALLCCGTHDALQVDDLVIRQVLRFQPVNCGLTFLRHIRDDRSLVEILGSINGTVKQDNLDTGGLCILKDAVPACGISSGEQQVVNLVLNELLSSLNLLLVLQAVGELCLIAVRLSEGCLEVIDVCGAVTGFVRIIVDDADADEVAAGACRLFCTAAVTGIGGAGAGRFAAACEHAAAESRREDDSQHFLQFHNNSLLFHVVNVSVNLYLHYIPKVRTNIPTFLSEMFVILRIWIFRKIITLSI